MVGAPEWLIHWAGWSIHTLVLPRSGRDAYRLPQIMKLRTTTTQGYGGEDGLAEGLGRIPSSLGHRCRHGWLSSVLASFAGCATAAGAQFRTAIIESCHSVIMFGRYRTLSLAAALGIIFSLSQGTAWGQTEINGAQTSTQVISSPLSSYTVTSTGSISTSGNNNYGIFNQAPVETFTNNGSISTSGSGSYGIVNLSTITTFNNTGAISASGPGSFGFLAFPFGPGITTLNNRQGASSSALTYSNKLPTNYNIIIGSTTNYGQLAGTSLSGTMVFGISTSSTITSSMVGQTLTGVLQGFGANLSTYITSGLTSSNGYTYTLTQQGSTGTWDLTITGGPALTRVTSVVVPSNATYGAGQDLSFTLNWSQAVDVTGTPRLALTIGSTTRYATYVAGSGTAALVFKYTVQSGDGDADGIAVGSSVDLNGGTLAVTGGVTYTPNPSLNSVGSTAAVLVVTTTAPGAPTSVSAVAANAQATVSFSAPASNGGAAITGYTVTSIPAGGTDSNDGSTSLSHVITGLTNGTSYTFTVTATNSAGTGSASTASSAVTPAAPPTLTSISPSFGTSSGGTSITITGTGLSSVTGVTIGGVAATSVVATSATTITATTPAGSAGAKSVLVTTAGGTNTVNTLYTYLGTYTDSQGVVYATNAGALTASVTTGAGWQHHDPFDDQRRHEHLRRHGDQRFGLLQQRALFGDHT